MCDTKNILQLAKERLDNHVVEHAKFFITKIGTHLCFSEESLISKKKVGDQEEKEIIPYFQYYIFDKDQKKWRSHHMIIKENWILRSLTESNLVIASLSVGATNL